MEASPITNQPEQVGSPDWELNIARLVWDGLSHAVAEQKQTPAQAEATYKEWFPKIPHAA